MAGCGDAVNIPVDSGDTVSENHTISFRARSEPDETEVHLLVAE